MRKRYLFLALGVMILASGCSKKESVVETSAVETTVAETTIASTEATEPEETTTQAPNEKAHQELYSVLSEESKAAETAEADTSLTAENTTPVVDYSRCTVHDIDGDGVDECFLDTSDGLVMYTFSDKVVSKPVEFSIGSDLYFTDSADCFYIYTEDDGYESWYRYSKGFDNESIYLLSSCEFDQFADENDEVQTVVYMDGVQVYGPEVEGYPDGLEEVMKNFKPKGVYLAEWNTSLEDVFEVRNAED